MARLICEAEREYCGAMHGIYVCRRHAVEDAYHKSPSSKGGVCVWVSEQAPQLDIGIHHQQNTDKRPQRFRGVEGNRLDVFWLLIFALRIQVTRILWFPFVSSLGAWARAQLAKKRYLIHKRDWKFHGNRLLSVLCVAGDVDDLPTSHFSEDAPAPWHVREATLGRVRVLCQLRWTCRELNRLLNCDVVT